ncbi:hypothetical protein C805_00087 [Eubacterium sp. 14-2]|uniref:phage tail protein n=1 Tax=Eubacterium sp. 14-2 TaxID=1235790 RepID=UPI00033F07C4|nr:hypothetical protein [Eubacterium sp. 14-2]EOT29503.1 hypothetical protein C805_00087 [Eubacterium sp. 14-2]
MAGYDGSIRINTQLDTRGFERGARGLLSGMERIGGSLRGIIGSLGFGLGIAGLISLGKQAIDTASDIQEVQNVVDTAFGSMSYKMEEFARNSVKQFGISQLSAKQLGSTFMAMGASMLDNIEEASDMAINLTARAADMASFYNKSVEETSYALKSIYTGETESLKEYGVVMTQVNMQEFARQQGINKSIQAMTQAEKVELQYAYVMQQTALSAGDFARTSDSWANQTRILSEQFKELLSVIGSGLITVLTPVIKFLNTVLSILIAIAKQIGSVLSKLFGISLPTADSGQFAQDLSSAAGGADELADGMDAAGSAAEKAGKAARKALAPFDKLNVLSKESGGGGGSGSGSGGAAGSGFELPELSFNEETEGADSLGSALDGVLNRLRELKDLFVNGFFEGLGDYKPIFAELKKDLISIGQTLKEIFTDPEVIAAANRLADQLAYSLGQVVGSMARIGLTIAQNLIGGIEKYLTQNKERIKQYIVSMFDIGTEIAAIIGNFSVALADIFSAFGSDTAQQITGNLIGIFAEVGMLISENAAKLGRDILNMITQPIINNKDKIKDAIAGTLEAIKPFTDGLLIAVQTVRDAVSDVYDNHLKPLFDSVADGISTIVGKIMDGYNTYIVPVLQGLGDRFKEIMEGPFGETIGKISEFIGKLTNAVKLLWEEALVPFIAWIADNIIPVLTPIFDFIGNIALTAIETITKVIGDIADVLSGVIDFVTGVFTGDWQKAWDGIKKIFSSIWNAIKDVFSGVWEILKNLVKNGVDFVKNTVSAAWNGIKSLTSTIWDLIKNIVSTVWNGMKSLASSIFNGIKNVISDIFNQIKSHIVGVWSGIKSALSDIPGWFQGKFQDAYKNIKNAFSGAKQFFSGVWSGIQNAFGNISGWFQSKFSAAWQAVKNVFSTGGQIFDGIKDGILNGLKAVINAIIGGINKAISLPFNGLNDALNRLRSVNILGLSPFTWIPTIKVPQIPYLASGAVIRGGDPFMAVLGDQRRGQTNIETPLPVMLKAFKQAMEESGGMGGDINVRVYLGEKDITKAVKAEADTYFKKTGKGLFAY